MDIFDLALVGWLFTIGAGLALVLGIGIMISLHLADEVVRRHLVSRVLDDSLLFGIWILGLAGGIGVLMAKEWSRWALELFCWSLAVLTLMSASSRWRAAPPPRGLLLLSLALFVLPLLIICVATILTLRGETALRVLSG